MKMLLAGLAVLQLCLTPALLVPSGDYWEEWGAYGECSRSCGGGVTTRSRRCITLRTDGGNNCVGPEKSYRSCNIQDCPEGSRDFREEQCSQFDGTDFQGKRYKWLPHYGAENPCELNCMPRGENFFYRHRTAVVDGTPCHPGRRDVCVGGVCKRLGCDNMLESPQQEDPCLQCGGSGQSCYPSRSSFTVRDLPRGYNQVVIIPVGATTISIRETVPTRNYLAIKNLRGEYYLNGHWVIEFSRATPIAGTMLYYQRGAEGDMTPETIIGRGPTTEPLVIELIVQEPNQGVEFEYYLPHGRSRQGYYWSHGSWSSCSMECGSGYQSRLVFCAIDNEAYPDYLCSSLPRPLSNRTCNPQPCPQTHRMAYLYPPHMWRPSEQPRPYVFSWEMGSWNPCSVSCGGGSQVRSVQCVSHEAAGPRVVEDAVCAAYSQAPPTLQTCNMRRCAEYRAGAWSQCSVTCGAGLQSRELLCVGSGGTRLEDVACSALPRPTLTQACTLAACPVHIGWHVGDWGLCSKSCGTGLRERQVICSDRERNLYPVERCSAYPKPSTVEGCNDQPCYSPQVVPSMQDPRGHDNTQLGFHPYVPDHSTVPRPEPAGPQTNTVYDPHSLAPALHCSQTYYGCCPDGRSSARGPLGQGCTQSPPLTPAQPSCTSSRYGCCQDAVTSAQGANREGCQEYRPAPTSAPTLPAENSVQCRLTAYGCCYDRTTSAGGPNGEGCPNPPSGIERSTCSLPRAAGSCAGWTPRYHYDVLTARCVHFWFGGCHGNNNNFLSRAECQRSCQSASPVQLAPRPATPSRGGATPSGGAPTPDASTPGRGRDTGSVQPGSSGRLGTNAATHAHRARVHLRPRRPVAVQQTLPAASLTSPGVSIDKSDPSSVEALAGQTVVLPCRVSPPPSSSVVVEWRRDGVPLPAHRHNQQPNGSLLVGPLTVADSGWLLCVATRDRARERDHRYIYLSVSEGIPQDDRPGTGVSQPLHPQPPRQPSIRFSIDRSGSAQLEGRAGGTVRLACRVLPASALPSVSLQWTRDGLPLTSPRHSQHSDGTLVIGQLSTQDSGTYTCTASTHQHLEQRQLLLRVHGDLITTAPNNLQVAQGDTARLPCVVSGDNVSVGWSRNGVPVRADGRNVQTSPDGSLILNNVQPSDEGSYTCNAYVGTYSVSATAEIRVSKPSQRDQDAEVGVPAECVDQPDLANCNLIVYARLCNNPYYASFCCASCARHAQGGSRGRRTG
ncbi:papilin isoform X2 [Osmerus mordax]|uniref:papilin isoform X2 n=1 Tax=Osmerus mordax TaxID=8014 RepID=UPI0035100B9E